LKGEKKITICAPFLGEISRLGNERKASVTHTKDFFGKKKWLKVILRTAFLSL
jgi:hypothetical protein